MTCLHRPYKASFHDSFVIYLILLLACALLDEQKQLHHEKDASLLVLILKSIVTSCAV